MRNLTLFICFLLASLTDVSSQNPIKKPITHASMWMMKRVGAPQISPDGKWVVFSVTEPSYEDKEVVNDLWIVPADGSSSPRRLTAGKGGESSYSWSPDGKTLAFTAKRDGDDESQIYLLPVASGGEAQRFTQLSTGASAPQWSPDGSQILFSSRVFSQADTDSINKKRLEEKKKQSYKVYAYNTFPVQNWDRWLDERETHYFVKSVEGSGIARNLTIKLAINKPGFALQSACWTPDNKSIVFSATTEAHSAAYQEPAYRLYQLAISGGEAKLLSEEPYDFSQPRFSEDGRFLYVSGNPSHSTKVYHLNRIYRFEWPSMSGFRCVSNLVDRPISAWAESDTFLYLNVEDQGRDQVWRMSRNGGRALPIHESFAGCLTNMQLTPGNSPVVVVNVESAVAPPELARIRPDGKLLRLTRFNDAALDTLDLQQPETFWITHRGRKIRSMLVRPAAFKPTNKYPLFVVMHGGPASSFKENWSYRWNYGLLASDRYALLLTDYTGSTGYGEAFGQAIQLDPLKGPADDINAAADEALRKFTFLDAGKQAAGGASYGGHLANWMQASTRRYRCLISHAGAVNMVTQWGTSDAIVHREFMFGGLPWKAGKLWKEQNPFTYADRFATPMLVTVGELDYRVPVANSMENWHILQRNQIPSRLLVFPEENHWILKSGNSKYFYEEVHSWLKKYLKTE